MAPGCSEAMARASSDDATEIERRLRGAKAGVELAEREECLDAHRASC
jgi:hypothetical protein